VAQSGVEKRETARLYRCKPSTASRKSAERGAAAFTVICALGLTASSAFLQAKGKAKAKGKKTTETKGKHGREAGDLPYGLERHTEKANFHKGYKKEGVKNVNQREVLSGKI